MTGVDGGWDGAPSWMSSCTDGAVAHCIIIIQSSSLSRPPSRRWPFATRRDPAMDRAGVRLAADRTKGRASRARSNRPTNRQQTRTGRADSGRMASCSAQRPLPGPAPRSQLQSITAGRRTGSNRALVNSYVGGAIGPRGNERAKPDQPSSSHMQLNDAPRR